MRIFRHTFLNAFFLISALALATAAEAQQRGSLIGKWSTAAGKCQRPLSIIVIGPKSLAGEDFGCDFDSVSRRGDVVTFRGKCTYGADDPVSETVVARLQGQRLYYRFLSVRGENGPFARCPR
jgi:hypothetical protein